MSGQIIYKVAFYLRLSRDDMDIDGRSKVESNSISSQRDLLNAYVREKDELEVVDTYIDDGYSGADFERPEFQRMLSDIYAGKINCVIVKDLSRFGRDYIEAGRYIQKMFPEIKVKQAEYAEGTALPRTVLTIDESSEYGDVYTDIKKYCDENIIAFITGSKSFDEWDNFVKEANSGKGMKVKDWMKPIFTVVVPVAIIVIYIYGMITFPWK